MIILKKISVVIGVVLEVLKWFGLPFKEGFRFCPNCPGIRASIPMKELDEGTILKEDTLFGIPQLCKGNFECRYCGFRQEFEQRRLPPAVKRRWNEYCDSLRKK